MKKQIVSLFSIIALALASASSATAAMQTYDFKDPKGVNNVQFKMDAPLESITGSANGLSGTVKYDPKAPEKTTGSIELASDSLRVGNPLMQEHMQGAQWLDVKNNPTIRFELKSVDKVRKTQDNVSAEVTGTLSLKGKTKEMTIPVTFTYLPGKLGVRLNKPEMKGDLLVIRSNFDISRSDFDLMAGQMTDKVADTIHLSLSIAGASQTE